MITKSRLIEVPKEWKTVIELVRQAIEGRRLLEFYYKSQNGNEGYRTVRPYMIIPNGENLELAGLPIAELSKSIENRQPGHYTISQLKERLESGDFEILQKTFDDPSITREKVDQTKGIPVCRFIYDDENPAEVKALWLRIKYV